MIWKRLRITYALHTHTYAQIERCEARRERKRVKKRRSKGGESASEIEKESNEKEIVKGESKREL